MYKKRSTQGNSSAGHSAVCMHGRRPLQRYDSFDRPKVSWYGAQKLYKLSGDYEIVEWHIENGTIVRDEGDYIEVKWD